MNVSRKRLISFGLILLIIMTVSFIWGNSMLDGESSTQLSNGLLERLRPGLLVVGFDPVDDLWLRKLAHFCEFALLGFELCLLFVLNNSQRKKAFISSSLMALFVAAIDEAIQLFTGRYSHVFDVVLDFSGAVFGAAFIIATLALLKKRIK